MDRDCQSGAGTGVPGEEPPEHSAKNGEDVAQIGNKLCARGFPSEMASHVGEIGPPCETRYFAVRPGSEGVEAREGGDDSAGRIRGAGSCSCALQSPCESTMLDIRWRVPSSLNCLGQPSRVLFWKSIAVRACRWLGSPAAQGGGSSATLPFAWFLAGEQLSRTRQGPAREGCSNIPAIWRPAPLMERCWTFDGHPSSVNTRLGTRLTKLEPAPPWPVTKSGPQWAASN
jgi:hypothetical protein